MSTPNPLVPAGSLMAERQRRNRVQFKVGVYAVLATQLMLILGLLFEGCRRDEPASGFSTKDGAGAAALPANAAPVVPREPKASPAGPRAPLAALATGSGAPTVRLREPSSQRNAPKALASGGASFRAGALGGLAESDLIYIVKSGDTWGRIAKAYGTTAQAMKAANDCKNERLVVGRKLKLPAGASLAAAATMRN